MPSAKRRISKALNLEFKDFAEEWLQPGGVLYIAEMCVFFRQHFPQYLLNENLSDVMITDQLMTYNELHYKAETDYAGMLVGVQVNRMQAFMAYKRAQQEEEKNAVKQNEEFQTAKKERDRELYSGGGDDEELSGIQSELEISQNHVSKFDDDEYSFNSASFQLGETSNHAGKHPALREPQTHDEIDISAHSNRSPTNVMDLMLDDVPLVAKTTKAPKKMKKDLKKKVTASTKTTTKKKKKTVVTAGAKDAIIPKKKTIKKKKKGTIAVKKSTVAANAAVKTKKKKKVTKKVTDSAGNATATTATASTKKKTTTKKTTTKKKKKGTAAAVAGASATAVKPKKKKKKAVSVSPAADAKPIKKIKKGVTKKKITKKKKAVQ